MLFKSLTIMSQGYLSRRARIKDLPSVYTPTQISNYLRTVCSTPSLAADEIALGKFPRTLDALEGLVRRHLRTFPYENTPMF